MANQGMPNPAELYEGAVKNTRDYLLAVKPEQLNASTPCDEWNVHQLIEHVVGGAAYMSAAIQGQEPAPPQENGNFVEAFDLHTSKMLNAMKSQENLERKIQPPFGGELSGAEFSFAAFMDVLIHGWDIAKATGQDTKLPESLVETCNAIFGPNIEPLRGKAFGPAVSVSIDASTQEKLLGIMGRKA